MEQIVAVAIVLLNQYVAVTVFVCLATVEVCGVFFYFLVHSLPSCCCRAIYL